MPSFACRARDEAESWSEKIIDAPTQHQAIAILEQEGLFPTRIERKALDVKSQLEATREFDPVSASAGARPEGRPQGPRRVLGPAQRGPRIGHHDPHGPRVDPGHLRNRASQEVLATLCVDLEGGSALSEALGRHPDVFPRVYVGTIAAGEKSGTLDEVLDDLAEFSRPRWSSARTSARR